MPILSPLRFRRTLCVTSTSVLIIYLVPSSMMILLLGASQEVVSSPTPIPNLGRGFLDLNRNPMGKHHVRPSSSSIQGQEIPQQQEYPSRHSDINHPPASRKRQQQQRPVDLVQGLNPDLNRHTRQLDFERRRKPTRRPTRPPHHPHPTVTSSTPTPNTEKDEIDSTTKYPHIENKGPGFGYCVALCKEGMGGLACECDIVPIG